MRYQAIKTSNDQFRILDTKDLEFLPYSFSLEQANDLIALYNMASEQQDDKLTDEELLKNNGWMIECESPFEIRHEDGSFATGQAAYIVVNSFR